MSKKYSLVNIEELSGGDTDFIALLVQTFLEEIPPDLEAMKQAVENDDAKQTYQFAHKMKPNLQLFDIDLQKQIKELESWADTNSAKEKVQPVLDHIVTTVNEAIEELKADFN